MAGIRDNIAGILETLNEPASSAILLGFLLTSDPCAALAESGGRMGGSFSSSSFEKSSSSPTRSYSFSSSYSSPSRSYSSSSSSPSRSRSSSPSSSSSSSYSSYSSPSKSYSSSSLSSSRSPSKSYWDSDYSYSSPTSSPRTSSEMSSEDAQEAAAHLLLLIVWIVWFYWIHSNIDRWIASWRSPAVHRSISDQNADNTSVAAWTKRLAF